MSKPLKVMVYDIFPDWLYKEKGANQIATKQHRAPHTITYHPLDSDVFKDGFNTKEHTFHGTNVAFSFLRGLPKDMKIDFVFANVPGRYDKKEQAKKLSVKEYKKLSPTQQIHLFKETKYLDTLVTKYKPDLILSSIGFSSLHGRQEHIVEYDRGIRALAKHRNIPFIQSFPNTWSKAHTAYTAAPSWKRADLEAPHIIVGNEANTPGFHKPAKYHDIVNAFLQNRETNYLLVNTQTGTTVAKQTARIKGNSFVAPAFAAMVVSAISQTRASFEKSTVVSLSLKYLLAESIKTALRSDTIDYDKKAYLKEMASAIASRYALQSLKREGRFSISVETLDPQLFLQSFFNTGALKQESPKK